MWSFKKAKSVSAEPGEIDEAVKSMATEMSHSEMQEAVSNFVKWAIAIAGKVPGVRDMTAGYYCMIDPATPIGIKARLLVPLVYLVVPVDAVPDVIPALGFTDDVVVWSAAAKLFSGHFTEAHYQSADEVLGNKA